jgi:hypothetical protein
MRDRAENLEYGSPARRELEEQIAKLMQNFTGYARRRMEAKEPAKER